MIAAMLLLKSIQPFWDLLFYLGIHQFSLFAIVYKPTKRHSTALFLRDITYIELAISLQYRFDKIQNTYIIIP